MVLRIFEMIATSGFLTALECTKFVFGRSSVDPGPHCMGEHTALPQVPSWFKGPYLYGGGERRKRRKEEGKGRGREGEGPTPLSQIPRSAPA